LKCKDYKKGGAELPLEASLSSWKIGDERFWAIMLRDIVRRKRNEEETARYITKMKEIDRAKSEFISLASHQLRTPLTNINLAAEILLRDASGGMNNEQKKYLKEICNDIERMAELIKTLLNVSRIELGNFLIELKLESLPEVVKNTLKEILPQIKNKKLKLKKSFNKDLPKINIDRNLIKIALQNLLSNAVKYTDRNGTIRVEIKKDNRNAIISVSDTGCGIPKNQHDKIFSKMFRADNVSEKTEGLGLGLYIVKSIIEQSGSRIWFESKINKGATFYIAVPLSGMTKKIS
jgi:signal transduction histidine kinase